MKKIFSFLLIFVLSFNCVFANDSDSPDLVGDGFDFDYDYNYSNDYYSSSSEFDTEPRFIATAITAGAFVEFIIGMGISIGLTGIALELVRTKQPIKGFNDMLDMGVDKSVVDSFESKYKEVNAHFSTGISSPYKFSSNWLKSINLPKVSKSLGYNVAKVSTVVVDEVTDTAWFKALNRPYYLIYGDYDSSGAYMLYSYVFRGGRVSGYDLYLESSYSSWSNTIKYPTLTSKNFSANNYTYSMSGVYVNYLNGRYSVKTNYPDFEKIFTYDGRMDNVIGKGVTKDVVTGIDVAKDIPIAIPNGGISVTSDAIANYPIPQKGSAELDEDGKIVVGELPSVVPTVQDYINSMTSVGDIVIDNTTDIPIEDDENTNIPFVFDGNVNIDSIGGEKVDSDSSFNFEPLMVLGEEFTNKFPFSLPWDLIDIVKLFKADPVAPKFDVEFKGENIVVLDLSQFESVVKIFRFFILLYFIVGLIKITGNLTQH